jgi:hypothetical protein
MAIIAAPKTGFLSQNSRGSEPIGTIGGNGTNSVTLTFPDAFRTYAQGVTSQNAVTSGYPT